jgi:hypothetical protein
MADPTRAWVNHRLPGTLLLRHAPVSIFKNIGLNGQYNPSSSGVVTVLMNKFDLAE